MAARETPATRAARAAGVDFTLHEYRHDPKAESYAGEAADALGIEPGRVFKTLVVQAGDELAVCIVPATGRLDLKAVGKRAAMADPARAEKVTGYVTGGISPLGQRRRLRTLVDESALAYETVFVSAGRRGLEIELSPDGLVALTDGELKPLAAPGWSRRGHRVLGSSCGGWGTLSPRWPSATPPRARRRAARGGPGS